MVKFKLSVAPIQLNGKPNNQQIAQIRAALTPTGLTITELATITAPPNSYTIAPALFTGGTLNNQSWRGQQVYYLDFDGRITVEDVLSRFKEFGITPNYYYHTFSHSEAQPRFRIVLLSDHVVEDASTAKNIKHGLLNVVPEADRACIDNARLFYGGVDCTILNDNPIPYHLIHALAGVAAITSDHGKTRYVPNRVSLLNYYKGTQIETNNLDKYIDYLKKLKDNKVDFEKLAERVQIFNDFINGKWLYHNELFGLATSLHWLKGGKKLFTDTMSKYNQLNRTNYDNFKLNIIKYVANQQYLPMHLSAYSPHTADHEYSNLITAIKLPIGQIERIKQPTYISLDTATAEFTAKFNEALNANDNNIYIFKLPTGFGKTTHLTNLTGQVLAFPTHALKDEVLNNMQVLARSTPQIPTFGSNSLNSIINNYYAVGLNDAVTATLQRIANGNEPNVSNTDAILAHNYLLQLNHPWDHRTTLLTTHQRILLGGTVAPTIIFDEDPIKDILSVQQTRLNDLILLNAHLPAGYDVSQLIDSIRGATPGVVYHTNPVHIPRNILTDTIANHPTQSNVIQLITSFAFTVSEQNNGTIQYIAKRQLDPTKKYIILSATVQTHLYHKLYPGRVQVVDQSNIQLKGMVNQYIDRSYSRASLTNDLIGEVQEQVSNLPIITFKSKKSEFEKATANMHYGNVLGYNELSGQNLAVVGTPHLNEVVYRLIAFAVGINPNLELDLVVRHIEYGDFRFCFRTFDSKQLQEIQLGLIESELIQAVGRARPLRNDCVVEVFSNLPLPFSRFAD